LEALLIDRWACRAVARVWPQRFMRIVNALVPALAHAAVEAARPLTAPQLADLMATSSAVYTPDGQPTGAAGLFALMEAAEDLITNAAPDDLQDTLEPIARALYARSDAVWSARAWLQRSISMGTSRRRYRGPNSTMSPQTVAVFQETLAQWCRPLTPDPYDWIEQEEALWRVYRVLTETLILIVSGCPNSAAAILAGAVVRGLVASTGRVEALATDSSERRIITRILGPLHDQTAWFEALWLDTYDTRERLQFPAHSSLDNPAHPILAWCLQVLNLPPTDGAPHFALARWFLDALAETRITILTPRSSTANWTDSPSLPASWRLPLSPRAVLSPTSWRRSSRKFSVLHSDLL